ncbi:RagB/SusD family nutrient uptake outer membrane protein [Mucilaginibacter paludis]|uniref:RagB/SusD domain-containing protein n=1 Tax=Mucilaginibacter paludis DSM 18603 TaxID=714943 RepID=H1Y400_9SPHI|nr:RagB/SusD family nutrient uptake outer membrane protein [Mucilaginibacter paludis]EHQ30945.1 hypothetical protein Mucpa_6896 [Mucilaginibacter paludis DSM 18603]
MKNYKNYRSILKVTLFIGWFIISSLLSCKKQDDFLNIKANKNDVAPTTLSDFLALMDDSQDMNSFNSITGLLGTDNIVISDVNVSALPAQSRNAYLWNKDIWAGGISSDWLYCYQAIEYSNIVLDGLVKIKSAASPNTDYNNVKGSALFFRAFNYYQIAQLFCKPYQSSSNADPGLPLRLNSDVNEKPRRVTVQQTYNQIIQDLQEAVSLLPEIPLYRTRPSSVAANGLLAKVYLSMQDYNNAFTYADKAIKSYPTLLDYNTLALSTSSANPFPKFNKGNPEVIFYAMTFGLQAIWSSSSVKARVVPTLYSAYDARDLRKSAFYYPDGTTGTYKFKGTYSAAGYNFCGIATDELYLIRAECSLRNGNLSSALADLNLLLKSRYATGSFQPLTISDPVSLMTRIILERRKEMPYTGNMRWEDLRRFNLDTQYATTLTRTYLGTTYTLLPNDNDYTLPLPDDEIQLGGLQQNPR